MYNQGKYNSQLCQDRFVDAVLQGRRDGYFVDLGAGTDRVRGHDISFYSNSYYFEHHLGWTGLAVDIDEVWIEHAQRERKCTVLCLDMFKENINDIFEKNNSPKRMDFISFDAGAATDKIFEELDLDTYIFDVVLFEHNAFYSDEFTSARDASRVVWEDKGYELICADIVYAVPGINGPVEDWWVHKSIMNDHIRSFKCSGLDCRIASKPSSER